MFTRDYSLGDGEWETGVYIDHDMPCAWKSTNLSYENLAAILEQAQEHDAVCKYGEKAG